MSWMEGLLSLVGAGPSSLDTGIDHVGLNSPSVARLPQEHKNSIRRMVDLPDRVSTRDVIQAADYASNAEASVGLLRKYAQHRLRAAGAHAQAYETIANYKKGIMAIDNRVQKTDARHGMATLAYGVNTQENAAQLSGYARAYQQAQQGFNF